MEHTELGVDTHGFYGIYYPNPRGSTRAFIAMLGLLAAAHYPDITMTAVISPGDSDMEGYYQEKGVERIRGSLMLLGAGDDCLWDTCRYIRRMEQRLKEKHSPCDLHVLTYEHGTHFLFPQTMLKRVLPIGSGLLPRLAFKAARDFPVQCMQARQDMDGQPRAAVASWMV